MPLLESMLLSFIANPSRNWTFQRFASVARYAKGPGFKSWRVSYFSFVPLRSFFLCYTGAALEGPISTGVSNETQQH